MHTAQYTACICSFDCQFQTLSIPISWRACHNEPKQMFMKLEPGNPIALYIGTIVCFANFSNSSSSGWGFVSGSSIASTTVSSPPWHSSVAILSMPGALSFHILFMASLASTCRHFGVGSSLLFIGNSVRTVGGRQLIALRSVNFIDSVCLHRLLVFFHSVFE